MATGAGVVARLCAVLFCLAVAYTMAAGWTGSFDFGNSPSKPATSRALPRETLPMPKCGARFVKARGATSRSRTAKPD